MIFFFLCLSHFILKIQTDTFLQEPCGLDFLFLAVFPLRLDCYKLEQASIYTSETLFTWRTPPPRSENDII